MDPTDEQRTPTEPDGEQPEDPVERDDIADPDSPGAGIARGEEPAEPNEPG